MGRQKIPVAIVCCLVSVSLVIYVLVRGEGPRRAGVTLSEEYALPSKFMPPDEETELPIWLTDYNTHVPLIGVLTAPVLDELEAAEQAERDALVDSLSPGVRANYEGARQSEHEREEAEYAAFIEERMRRLSEGRARRK